MPAIRTVASTSPKPLQVLQDAIRWAINAGYTIVTTEDLGVVCVSIADGAVWRADPFAHALLSPVGAAILQLQPDVPNTDVAAAAVMGGSVPFAEGVIAGIAKRPSGRMMASASSRLYLQGLEVGTRCREDLLSDLCAQHGVRHWRTERCPSCVEAEIGALEAGE